MPILFIIFLPKGILGGITDMLTRRRPGRPKPPPGHAAEAKPEAGVRAG